MAQEKNDKKSEVLMSKDPRPVCPGPEGKKSNKVKIFVILAFVIWGALVSAAIYYSTR